MKLLVLLFLWMSFPHFLLSKSIFRKVSNAKQNKEFKSKKIANSSKDGDLSLEGMRIARVPNKVSSIQVPENIGIVKDSYRAPGDKIVIHIQDAHCNYEAQGNISKIIETLVKQNNLKLLCVEGSEGLIDVSAFASVPYEKIKKEVADFFMKKGRITGPEYYAVVSGKDVELYGIEKKQFYDENLNAFKKTMPYRPRFEYAVAKIKNVFEELKPKIYNRHLILIDSKYKLYKDQELTFSKYSEFLVKMAEKFQVSLDNYQSMEKFAIISKLENDLEFDLVQKERMNLLEIFSKKASKRHLETLGLKATLYRNGKITAGKYHEDIVRLAKTMKVNQNDFKNLFIYAEYISAYEKINHEDLYNEKDLLEEDIKMKLFEKTEQKMLCDLDKVLEKIDSFYQLEMTRDDLKFFDRKRELFSFSKFLSFIGTYAPRYNVEFDLASNIVELDNFYEDFLDYYECAKKRDAILNERTLHRMEETGQKIAVQVCGGFHTDGMTAELKEKNISYVVLSPKITKDDPNNPYLDILLGHTEPLDEFFENGLPSRENE